jgi:hypothetical protein
MKTEKQQAIELIDRLPDDVSTETILTELQFKLALLRRGADAEHGRNVVSDDDARQRLAKWLT